MKLYVLKTLTFGFFSFNWFNQFYGFQYVESVMWGIRNQRSSGGLVQLHVSQALQVTLKRQTHRYAVKEFQGERHAVFVPRRGGCFCFKKKKKKKNTLSFPLQLMFLSLLCPPSPLSPLTSSSLPPLVLQYVPPDLCICNFVLEQSLSVRALQEMLANTGQNSEGVSISLLLLLLLLLLLTETPALCVSQHKHTLTYTNQSVVY